MRIERSPGAKHWFGIFTILGVFLFSSGLLYGRQMIRVSKPVSLDRENLTTLRDSPMAKGIGEGFCTAIIAPKVCPECVENFMGADEYRDVLSSPFLLVDSEANDFGGYFMLVVFKSYRQVYRLWVYQLSSGEFQLREMVPYIKLNKLLMDELRHEDYFPYWLNACKALAK